MLAAEGAMADTDNAPETLLGDLATLEPSQRREVAAVQQTVAETFAEVPDGRNTAHALRLLAYWLDPS
jgi:hypothetical protein